MANPSNLAAALQYKQRQDQLARADQQLEGLFNRAPATEPQLSTRESLENLSMGLGRGRESDLEGTYQLATKPIQSAKAMYQGAKEAFKNPAMIADALKYVGKQAASGPLGFGEVAGGFISPRSLMPKPMMQEMTTYHGTPHRFPATEANPLGEFDASKIGTGEGAQSYGHGLYLAETRDVAKGYQPRDRAMEDVFLKKYAIAEKQQDYGAMEVLENFLLHKSPDEVAESLAESGLSGVKLQKAMQALDFGKKQYKEQQASSLYKVDLPDDQIAKMLDYDKPMKDQPEALKIIRGLVSDDMLESFDENVKAGIGAMNVYKNYIPSRSYAIQDVGTTKYRPSGVNSYEEALAMVGGNRGRVRTINDSSDKAVSEILRKAGIPGIKYFDGVSRDAGKGTRNFVVFPGEEKKLKILERN